MFAATVSLHSPATQTPPSPVEVLAALKGFRKVVLGDLTPVDFCKVGVFWTSAGEPVDTSQSPKSRYSNRSQCKEPKKGLPYVSIESVRVFADSVVVDGETRIGNVARGEIYVFSVKPSGALSFRQFRIEGLIHYD